MSNWRENTGQATGEHLRRVTGEHVDGIIGEHVSQTLSEHFSLTIAEHVLNHAVNQSLLYIYCEQVGLVTGEEIGIIFICFLLIY